jgi:RNA polymerase sigma-70 factor (ECF subfamily)
VTERIIDDEELARRIADGDDSAFSELYARYKNGVYLYCIRFLGQGPAAEDMFQEVFIKCYEQLRSGTVIHNVKSYLLSAVHNRSLNVLRDRKHSVDIDENEDLLPVMEQDTGQTHDIQYALSQIAPDLREAILLCEYQGYTYNEIAQITNVPLTTVRKRIFRARQLLRTILSTSEHRLAS